MSGMHEQVAAYACLPKAGEIFRVAMSAAAGVRYVIPAWMKNKMLDILVTGADAQINCGDNTVSVTIDQVSSVDGSGNITVNGAEGKTLQNGVFVAYRMHPDATHFFVRPRSANAAYFIEISATSPDNGDM